MSPRARFGLAASLCVPLGLAAKRARGEPWSFVADHGGGAVYVLFWTFCLLSALPRLAAWRAAACVFLGTALIEFSQLVNHPSLEAARNTVAGGLLLGSTFSIQDFPYYLLGAACAAALGSRLARR